MKTQINISEPDDFYDLLLSAHSNLNARQSADFNSRLLFLFANQIGDMNVLSDCIVAAGLDIKND